MPQDYTSTSQKKRFSTREVAIGKLLLGSHHPIRLQSMTTSPTHDVDLTVEQIIRLADAGCDLVRVTVQGKREARACGDIKNTLLKRGIDIPLVADIHFYPPAALIAADFVDKIRINPGNFADKRASFKILEYDDISYAKELEKLEEKFLPLVLKCKQLNRAMRIGTNHGSLSDRILNRFGNTPRGMVESALEFAHICRRHHYHQFLFSMKSSNPQVMIQAYRLLIKTMQELHWDYPIHLGVTESGDGEDGRVKSSIGIGSLLLDGIGDTIRVSLTEDPWKELDPCQRLKNLAERYSRLDTTKHLEEKHRSLFHYQRRHTIIPSSFHPVASIFLFSTLSDIPNELDVTLEYKKELVGYEARTLKTPEGILVHSSNTLDTKTIDNLKSKGITPFCFSNTPLTSHISSLNSSNNANRFSYNPYTIYPNHTKYISISEGSEPYWKSIISLSPELLFLSPKHNHLHFSRSFFEFLQENNITIPVILNFSYSCSEEDMLIQAAAECGSLLCDGLGDGLALQGPYSLSFLLRLSHNILQASRLRISKTEYISCPSCGRTLFDLQQVTERIRNKTNHLPGIKIAIMGCIVNGPGEMADADFGYVGSKAGKIDLYLGKICVEKNIDFSDADERLITLIKQEGKWTDPPCSKK